MNKIKLYVPALAKQKLDAHLKLAMPHCGAELYDKLMWIMDLIYRLPTKIKNYTFLPEGFVAISSQEFFAKYFDDLYKARVNLLIDGKVLECNESFCKVKGVPLGYRINPELISDLVPHVMRKTKIREKVLSEINERKASLRYAPEYVHRLRKFLWEMKIDAKGAIKYVDYLFAEGKIDHDQRNSYMLMIFNIDNGGDDLYFSRCKTNGRIDTNLTNLASCLKQFINVDQDLIQTDLCNSQPTLLNILIQYNNDRSSNILSGLPKYLRTQIKKILNSDQLYRGKFKIDSTEAATYMDWTLSGQFYERFRDEYNARNLIEQYTRVHIL